MQLREVIRQRRCKSKVRSRTGSDSLIIEERLNCPIADNRVPLADTSTAFLSPIVSSYQLVSAQKRGNDNCIPRGRRPLSDLEGQQNENRVFPLSGGFACTP